jgi:hypothetical protein
LRYRQQALIVLGVRAAPAERRRHGGNPASKQSCPEEISAGNPAVAGFLRFHR